VKTSCPPAGNFNETPGPDTVGLYSHLGIVEEGLKNASD